MNRKAIMKHLSLKIMLFVIAIFVVWFHYKRHVISIGEIEWIDLGDNKSVIKFNGKDIVGPGGIELNVSSNIVYGMVVDDNFECRWFAICVTGGKVYTGKSAYQVEEMLLQEGVTVKNFNFGCIYYTIHSFKEMQSH